MRSAFCRVGVRVRVPGRAVAARTCRSCAVTQHDSSSAVFTRIRTPSDVARLGQATTFRQFAASNRAPVSAEATDDDSASHMPEENETTIPVDQVPDEEAERLFFDAFRQSGTDISTLSKNIDAILDAYEGSPDLAERFLEKLHTKGHDWNDVSELNLLLRAWSKLGNPERAGEVLLQSLYIANWESYAHVLHAWTKMGKSTNAPTQSTHLIKEMEKNMGKSELSSVCYLFALDCWATSNRAAAVEKGEPLFKKMNSVFRTNEKLQIQKLAKFGLSKDDFLSRSMGGMLVIYSKANNAHAAEDYLLELMEGYTKGKHNASPTLDMYYSVLSAWTKSKSSRRAARAERLVLRLETEASSSQRELPAPDIICYSLALNAWAKSEKPYAGASAESLLRRMPMKPNIRLYTSVLTAWSRSDNQNEVAVDGAEKVWAMMTSDNELEKPDDWAITTMVTVWSQSSRKDAMERAESYFSLLEHPSAVESYTALMQAWARHAAQRGPEAVERVEALLRLPSAERPNSRTFAAVLQTIAAARGVNDRGRRADRILEMMDDMKCKITPYIFNIAQRCHGSIKKKNTPRKKKREERKSIK